MKNIKYAVIAASVSFCSLAMAVTEAEYQANKNDTELARTYAAELFAQKKFDRALAVIEDVIVAKPVDLAARFFRIQIMITLGRGEEVLDELEFMTTLKLPASDIDRAKNLIELVKRNESPLNATVSFKMGFDYNGNANSYNETGQTWVTSDGSTWTGTARTDTANNATKKLADTIYNTSVGYFGSYKLNEDKTRNLNFALSSTYKNGTDTINSDGVTTLARFGYEENIGNFKTELSYTSVKVNKKHNSTSGGTSVAPDTSIGIPGLSMSYKFNDRSVSYAYTSAKSKNTGIGAASDYDNTTGKHKLSFSSPLGKQSLALLSYESGAYKSKNSSVKNAYDKDITTLSGTLITIWKAGHRTTLKYSSSSKDNKYSFQNYKREDTSTTLSANYTVSGDVFYEPLKDWSFTFGYKNSQTDSNNPTYDVKANSYGLTVERRWSQY